MTRKINRRIHIRAFASFMVFILCLFLGLSMTPRGDALDLANRTIRLSSSFAGEVVSHEFTFDLVGNSTVTSIGFEYCSNSPLFELPCVAPAGLDVTGASINTQNGMTGFSVSGLSVANHLVLDRPPFIEVPVSAQYIFDDIVNPTTPDEIVYVRISLYDGPDASGNRVDQGSVVFVVEDRFDIDAYVPPYLTFCVGVTVALDCSSTTGFLADFGEFSEFEATAVTTQFAVATNDPTGYNTFINGATMTSGSNIITPLATQTVSNPGTSQFGINLRSNSNPSVGSNPQNGTVSSGAPDSDYNIPNRFRFVNGDRIAGSAISTGFNRYTVSYIVNVPEDQAPGVYAATYVYTSIASF